MVSKSGIGGVLIARSADHYRHEVRHQLRQQEREGNAVKEHQPEGQ
jgi:hypothetical protein